MRIAGIHPQCALKGCGASREEGGGDRQVDRNFGQLLGPILRLYGNEKYETASLKHTGSRQRVSPIEVCLLRRGDKRA